MSGEMFRVVVIGVGLAGRARIRDLPALGPTTKGLENVELAGFVSRRTIDDIPNVKQLNIDDVLKENNGIHAVVISTENAYHEEVARRALEAGKHVLVDFPLVPNANGAKQLFQLAKEKGVLCYEEDIALETDRYLALKKIMKQQQTPLVNAELTMTVGLAHKWLADTENNGSPFHTSMDLLHAQVDLLGDLTPKSCTMTKTNDGLVAKALASTKDNGQVSMTIQYVNERKREKVFKYTFSDGTVIDQTTELEDMSHVTKDLPKPLFLRDLVRFVETVRGNRDNSYNQWLTVRCLEIADEFFAMSKQGNI